MIGRVSLIITKFLLGPVSDTGVPEIDNPVNKAFTIFTGIVAVFGWGFLLYNLVRLGLAFNDQDSHSMKAAIKGIVGAIIAAAAGTIVTIIMAA